MVMEANLIAVSNRAAVAQGVSKRVTFLQQDLYEADLSQATVVEGGRLSGGSGGWPGLKPLRWTAVRN